ncbi:MAG TPA: hypothetical protein VE932_16560 [Patescibacteria group bacterium]|nr:hypothetical protein [Patescibacteria group bacterium]
MWRAVTLAAVALAALIACTSPEATRQRAGGPGADVGNHGRVELHEGAKPYSGTPVVMPQVRGGDVAASPRSR